MGAGIALTISQIFPQAFAADLRTVRGDTAKMGKFSFADARPYGKIFNMYTQFYPGREQKRVLNAAIARSFRTLNNTMPEDFHLGIPQIGCGIAGGTWSEVKEIINDETPNLRITLVNYKPKH